jgi:hypothetical protein
MRELREAIVDRVRADGIGIVAAGMDVAADVTGTAGGTGEGIVADVAANGRRRLRGRMRDVWMLCASGLLRVDRGFRRERTRRSSCRRVHRRWSRSFCRVSRCRSIGSKKRALRRSRV